MRRTHDQLMKIALSRQDVKREYDALKNEFTLHKALIKARLDSGKTQSEIAKAMGTTTSVVGRLETGGGKQKHSPTLATLQKYAAALNCQLQLKIVPFKIRKHA